MINVLCVPRPVSTPVSVFHVRRHTPLIHAATLEEFLDLLCRDAETMTEEDWDNYQILWEKIKLEGLYND